MRYLNFALLFLSALTVAQAAPSPITPSRVAILYNSTIPESKKLAEGYAKAREIPTENLIGLPMRKEGLISRELYNQQIKEPLREHFNKKNWWTLTSDSQGNKSPIQRNIDVIVCMRGVPFRINRIPKEKDPHYEKIRKNLSDSTKMLADMNEASLDSELCYFGVEGLPISGPLRNQYFKKDTSFSRAKIPQMFLVGRIDGPTWADCARMITDAIKTERTGLWGFCYLDESGRNPLGDEWLRTIAARNSALGIPNIIDKNKDTFPTCYPMEQAATYYGWYSQHRDGPLLNPDFRFKRGAIAVHLHSFSAEQIRLADTRWVGPLVTHGAAGTLGNVWEPYLGFTHHFDEFHRALTRGHSLVEAAYMAIPVLSWHNLVIGDPLYRPFLHLQKAGGTREDSDNSFRAYRAAAGKWGNNPDLFTTKIRSAAARNQNGLFYEMLGLRARASGNDPVAKAFFSAAKQIYGAKSNDSLRADLHLIDLDRSSPGGKPAAIAHAKTVFPTYSNLKGQAALKSILTILDPPAPPPVKPGALKPSSP